jgi:hypothetical protein
VSNKQYELGIKPFSTGTIFGILLIEVVAGSIVAFVEVWVFFQRLADAHHQPGLLNLLIAVGEVLAFTLFIGVLAYFVVKLEYWHSDQENTENRLKLEQEGNEVLRAEITRLQAIIDAAKPATTTTEETQDG